MTRARAGAAQITARQRNLLHVAKAALRLSDSDYRALLGRSAGVASSTELDHAGFERVIGELERLGFRPGFASKPRSQPRSSKRMGMATDAQLEAIRSAWRMFSGQQDEQALRRWLEKHSKVSHIQFLDASKAGKAIAVLKKMLAWKATHPDASPRRGHSF